MTTPEILNLTQPTQHMVTNTETLIIKTHITTNSKLINSIGKTSIDDNRNINRKCLATSNKTTTITTISLQTEGVKVLKMNMIVFTNNMKELENNNKKGIGKTFIMLKETSKARPNNKMSENTSRI